MPWRRNCFPWQKLKLYELIQIISFSKLSKMERFFLLLVEIPNSEGRMTCVQCWKEKAFLFTNGKRHLCVYLPLSSFYIPSSCMNTLDQAYYLAHYLFFPIFKKFGHQKIYFLYNRVFYCNSSNKKRKTHSYCTGFNISLYGIIHSTSDTFSTISKILAGICDSNSTFFLNFSATSIKVL